MSTPFFLRFLLTRRMPPTGYSSSVCCSRPFTLAIFVSLRVAIKIFRLIYSRVSRISKRDELRNRSDRNLSKRSARAVIWTESLARTLPDRLTRNAFIPATLSLSVDAYLARVPFWNRNNVPHGRLTYGIPPFSYNCFVYRPQSGRRY